ncbi:MAG: hypothetical protein MZV65_51670 [Chromatiales bacterium]|nr:hypothetical protein [Chromatiales bacterium]
MTVDILRMNALRGICILPPSMYYSRLKNQMSTGSGDLLVTNLDGFAMPLLRYRLGDRVALCSEPCSCGLTLPVLTEVAGRRTDFLLGRDDRLIHSAALVGILRDLPNLKQFRIIQHQDLSIEILLVAAQPLAESDLSMVRQRMQAMMCMDLPIQFTFLDYISPLKSGKYSTLISEAYVARFLN